MADRTSIEWTDASWNNIHGCTRLSPGCQNCYAERMSARFSGPGEHFEGVAKMTPQGPRWTGTIKVLPRKLDEPLRWKKPRMIFVNSMSDTFHQDVPSGFLESVFEMIAIADRHTYQILTKRPDRMRDFLASHRVTCWKCKPGFSLPDPACDLCKGEGYHAWAVHPYPNVWLGTTCEDQEQAGKRIPYLLQTPAAVRFLSVEPMLGPVDLLRLKVDIPGVAHPPDDGFRETAFGKHLAANVDWVICGAESGPGARNFEEDWARNLRDQCQAAGVPFMLKQRIVNGKKVSLPELDGKVWDEMPKANGG